MISAILILIRKKGLKTLNVIESFYPHPPFRYSIDTERKFAIISTLSIEGEFEFHLLIAPCPKPHSFSIAVILVPFSAAFSFALSTIPIK